CFQVSFCWASCRWCWPCYPVSSHRLITKYRPVIPCKYKENTVEHNRPFNLDLTDDSGASTAKYTIVTFAAVALAAVHAAVISSETVQDLLESLIERALNFYSYQRDGRSTGPGHLGSFDAIIQKMPGRLSYGRIRRDSTGCR